MLSFSLGEREVIDGQFPSNPFSSQISLQFGGLKIGGSGTKQLNPTIFSPTKSFQPNTHHIQNLSYFLTPFFILLIFTWSYYIFQSKNTLDVTKNLFNPQIDKSHYTLNFVYFWNWKL